MFNQSHRAVSLKGQVPPDREEQDSGLRIQRSQSGLPLQEGQLATLPVQTLLQLEPEQGGTGSSGSSGVMIQLLTSPVQELQPEPEQGGTGSSGQSIQIPHQLLQTWKFQVEVVNQLASWIRQ